MKPASLQELLRFAPGEGSIYLGRHRVLLLDANAMGALRKSIVDTVGVEHARGIFARFGFACGFEDALNVRDRLGLENAKDWLEAGPRLHSQLGHVRVETLELRGPGKDFRLRARWRRSYEAEQHRRYLGLAREPSCWSLTGYASGWATAVLGEKTLTLETDCEAKGDPCCKVEMRRASDWGEKAASIEKDLVEQAASENLVEKAIAKEREAHSMFYQAYRQSNDVMFYCDPNAVILDVNDAFIRVYGYSREEAIGRTPNILRSKYTTRRFYERMWKSLLDPKLGYWKGELINRTKDGREVPVLLSITAVRDASGRVLGYVSNALDTSEQRSLLARVAQSEALAGVGEMAAVVAHEIRNPLGSVVMAAKQLSEGGLSKEDRELVVKVLREEGSRLNQTLTNFLSYARPREPQLKPADLNALVSEVAAAARSNPELLGSVKLRTKLDPSLAPFPFDPEMLRQVLWNLVLNALQALEGKGALSLETSHEAGRAVLRVADTGPGVRADASEIFKPFYTTKSKGTGLGLAIADRIVKAHGGRIELEERGAGASFVVSLPSAENRK